MAVAAACRVDAFHKQGLVTLSKLKQECMEQNTGGMLQLNLLQSALKNEVWGKVNHSAGQ